ncbi:hypothetical protein COV24_00570 [candidate division WWE3 bacterium CG10_big_fil_rev_8_21_14_0_10_32_10]|uniref:Uncharacterized protein n=1 Tax=candidate division WWE3 bacterium CG10_big_fil_rev_8_21_14_0_10_32_10 TaxID=1975090 RepID=A0A2H0RBC6_UNCKA|nr:MAG: hypothetical protein COV24_00570 [candidate division WWE3 bacterium CG10_big_fil_rev_8_21_14_0_10_32_10]
MKYFLIISTIFLVGIGSFFVGSNYNEIKNKGGSIKQEVIKMVDTRTPEQKIKSAVTGNEVVSCEVEFEGFNGIMYINGKDLKLEGTFKENDLFGKMTDSLSKQGTVYLWSKNNNIGYTMDSNKSVGEDGIKNLDSLLQMTLPQLKDAEEKLGIKAETCSTYTKSDEKLFEVPSNVEFKTIEEHMGDILKDKMDEHLQKQKDELMKKLGL